MTTAQTSIPIPRRRVAVRPQVWVAVALILVTGSAAAITILLLASNRTDPQVVEYRQSARTVITGHNGLARRWNEFVPRFNEVPTFAKPELDAAMADGLTLTTVLVRDSQAVLNGWRRIVPPESLTEAHRLGLAALEATQDGYIAYESYFRYASLDGFLDGTYADIGREKLEEAALLWDQARLAEGP